MTIKLAVVAKYLLEREGLVRLVARSRQFDVIGVASSAAELAGVIDGDKPDVVVVVVGGSPRTDGLDGSRELPELDVDTALVVLGRRPDARLAATLLAQRRAGRGYLVSQRQDRRQLLDAIKAVASGETVLDPHIVDALIADRREDDQVSPTKRLTPRELEVLAAIADGLSNGSIARSLQLTLRGVERHVSAIFRKLELRDGDKVDRRVGATLLYLESRPRTRVAGRRGVKGGTGHVPRPLHGQVDEPAPPYPEGEASAGRGGEAAVPPPGEPGSALPEGG